MLTLSLILLGSGLLTTLVCLPLVFGKVPPNAVYGFRTRQTFASPRAWADLNEVGGMAVAQVGFPLMLGGGIGLFLPDAYVGLVGTATAIVCLLSIGLAVGLYLRYAAKYAARGPEHASGERLP